MNEPLFRALLEEIAEQEVSDDMNLWPNIQQQLASPPSRRKRAALHFATYIVVLAFTLLAAVVVYAVVQDFLYGGDSGLEAVNEENLITYLNLSQVVDGITVTVDYAYADANRIVVNYNALGTASADENVAGFQFYDAILTDDQGRVFGATSGVGGGGGGGGGGSEGGMVSFGAGAQAHYDASIMEGTPKSLNLKLSLTFGVNYTDDKPPTSSSADFEFSIPFNPGLSINVDQTAATDDMEIHLRKVVIAPSLTHMEICHTPLSEADGGWGFYGDITVDGEELVPFGQMIVGEASPGEDGLACRAINLPEALDEQPGEWTLTITALKQFGSEDEAVVAEELQDQYGIVVTLHPDGGYSYDTPDTEGGREDVAAALGETIMENLNTIDGPWIFTFDVP